MKTIESHSYLLEYWAAIKNGSIKVGAYQRKAVRNLVRDLQDPAYIYDTREAHKRIKFQETFCLQSKAPYYGKPLKLLLWQKAWWECVYSFKMADTGLRRFTHCLLLVARKNGKSTMMAADAMYDLVCGPGGNDICCASNDDKQARLIWEEIKEMRQRFDPKKALTADNITRIYNQVNGTKVLRLSAKMENLDGFCFSKTYLDEAHDISEDGGQSSLAEACWRSMSTKDDPLFICCTTQGFNRDCYLDYEVQYSKRVIDGEIDDIHRLAWLFEQDSEQEIWQDPDSWQKSNPSLPAGIKKRAKLENDIAKARVNKAARLHMLTKDFNIPQATASTWLLLEDYSYSQVIDLEDFRGCVYLGAVDLAATTDLANAKILIMRPGDKRKYIYSHYFIPETKLEQSNDKEAGAEYADWARAGYVTIHEGSEVDISAVADWFYALYKDYNMKPLFIGYDQRYAKNFIDRCVDIYGFDIVMLTQGRYLSNAMKLTESDLKAHLIEGLNPVDKWCLANTCCMVDNREQIQPVKIRGQHAHRIDGGVTLIMIEEVYRRNRSDYINVVEAQNGIS